MPFMEKEIELIPNQKEKSSPLSPTRKAYERFRDEFYHEVKPTLDLHRELRALSEEAAKHHYVG